MTHTNTNTNTTIAKVSYAVEVKASNAYSAYPFVFNSGRVYVRGYIDGKCIYEETIGYCNKNRMATTRSQGGRLLASAHKRAAELANN